MKKQLLYLTVAFALAVVTGWNVNQSRNEMALSDVALENVEALAEETIPTPGICTQRVWFTPSQSCCDLIKHCESGGNTCC
jgi:hypothetical protein